MQIEGKIKLIRPIQQVSEKFQKREFVIETSEQYPQSIQLELHQDRVDIIESFAEGEEVKCHLNLKGRLWVSPQGEDRYFNTIICWRIEKVDSSATPPLHHSNMPAQKESPSQDFKEEEHDDLPF